VFLKLYNGPLVSKKGKACPPWDVCLGFQFIL